MDIFRCKYIIHKNEEIIGFCLNQNCQNATQYCYECLTSTHSEHQNDRVRFSKMNKYINEFIEIYNQSTKQFKEISKSVQNCFEQILKIMEQEVKKLEKMAQHLQNKEYLDLKSKINIIKKLFSKEKENQICMQQSNYNRKTNNVIYSKQEIIIQLNNILGTIQNIVTDLTNGSNQIISDEEQQNNIKIKVIQEVNEDEKQQNIIESERFFNKGLALRKLNKYQEAIECYDKAIAINPKSEQAWDNKDKSLYYLGMGQQGLGSTQIIEIHRCNVMFRSSSQYIDYSQSTIQQMYTSLLLIFS